MSLFKKLSVSVFAIFGVILAVNIARFILGDITLLRALAPIWIPVAALFYILLFVCIFARIGDRLKANDPDSCGNCVFGKARTLIGHCIGESEGCKFGEICKHYKRI